jgi:hypothetical protein
MDDALRRVALADSGAKLLEASTGGVRREGCSGTALVRAQTAEELSDGVHR